MGKKIKYKVFLAIFLVSILSELEFPQEMERDPADSLIQSQLDKLNTNSFDNLVLFLYLNRNNTGLKYYVNNAKKLPLLFNTNFNSDISSCNPSPGIEKRIKIEFNSYLKFRSSLILKTDLGETGKFLNRSKKVAAFILLIIHLHKYQTKSY